MEEENLIENAAQQGARLKKHLKELQLRQRAIGAVTGKGLMIGTHLIDENGKPDGERAGRMLKALEKRGLLMIKCGPWGGNVVRWIPPLIVTQEEIDWAVEQFELALEETA